MIMFISFGLIALIVLVLICIIFFGLVVIFLFCDMVIDANISEQQFLDSLGYEWKTGIKIQDELIQNHCSGRRFFRTVSMGWLYVILNSLKEKGLIEIQNKQLTKEELSRRGGRPAKEYRRVIK